MLPLPQRMRTGPCGASPATASASAVPAASISSASGIPCSSIAQRSTARMPSASKRAEPGSISRGTATAAAKSREWVSETSIRSPAAASAARPREPHGRRLAGDDLDLAQAEAVGEAERLDHRLLGGEAGGEVAAGAGAGRGIVALGLGEDPLGEARVALQRPLQPAISSRSMPMPAAISPRLLGHSQDQLRLDEVALRFGADRQEGDLARGRASLLRSSSVRRARPGLRPDAAPGRRRRSR